MRAVPPPGAHGGDGIAVAHALGLDPDSIVDLSQSLNPLAPDVTTHVKRHLSALRHYPDPQVACHHLAQHMSVDSSRLLLTNGGAEAISLLAREIGGSVREPEFLLHPRLGGPMWRSNPHNPSGLLAGADDRADVWDEAYFPLATGMWTRGDADCVVVGSLTKLFACPGLRIGYVIAAPEMIERFSAQQPAWSVNSLALASVPEMLETADLLAWSRAIASLRDDLIRVLSSYEIATRPSDANWVLVDEPSLREKLAPLGVVVRDCASFGLPGVARIAVPTADQLERLDRALDVVMSARDTST